MKLKSASVQSESHTPPPLHSPQSLSRSSQVDTLNRCVLQMGGYLGQFRKRMNKWDRGSELYRITFEFTRRSGRK